MAMITSIRSEQRYAGSAQSEMAVEVHVTPGGAREAITDPYRHYQAVRDQLEVLADAEREADE